MKKLIYSLSLLAMAIFVLPGCGGDDGEEVKQMTDQQKAAKALKDGSPWAVTTVNDLPEGSDEEALMGMQISFGTTGSDLTLAPGSFTSGGVSDRLTSDAGATWAWSGTSTSVIALTNGFTAELTDIKYTPGIENATSVTLTFSLPEAGGRASGMGGYTVTLE